MANLFVSSAVSGKALWFLLLATKMKTRLGVGFFGVLPLRWWMTRELRGSSVKGCLQEVER